MAQNRSEQQNTVDPTELQRSLENISAKSQQLVKGFLNRERSLDHLSMDDALRMSKLFRDLHFRLMADPVALGQAQLAFWKDYISLVRNTTMRMMGFRTEPVIEPSRDDKRFKHESWEENPLFDFIKQSYLLTADYVHHTVKNAEGGDDRAVKKIDFYTRQFVDSMSPSNFVATNPEVLRKTVDSRGQNLLNGLEKLLEDLERGNGKLNIRQTDPDAFKVGEDLAVTPGKVVYQNDLMQLIQYEPSTEKVYRRPLLIVPPWINKYYIMDLQPGRSLIKYLVDQGYTVFVISWVNPHVEHAGKGFDDYFSEGPLEALDKVQEITGEDEINMAGYCLGGTLLGCTLAYCAANGDTRPTSATFFATLLDFSSPGELGIFIDEEQIQALEKRMERKGFMEGSSMAATMNSLRANDLIWSFFVNNYLHGEDPFPFDILYWNQDSTNMPFKMHSYYLRTMYQENRLMEPGGIILKGTPIDLSKVKIPAMFIGTRDDHIAPWHACYAGSNAFSGTTQFVLGGSGHIAGIINPPEKNKYCYWVNRKRPADPEKWLEGAEQHEGSWWPHWHRWLANKSGAKVAARQPGGGKLKPIEDAPGSYVKERHD